MACPPIDIAQAIKTALDAAVVAGTLTPAFDCRAGIVFQAKLPDLPGAGSAVIRPLVDVCIQPRATMELTGRYRRGHVCPVRIGVRQVLSSACYREDGTIDLDKITPQVTLLYDLMKFLMPSVTNDHYGQPFASLASHWIPPMEIVFAYEPDLLQTDKLYCGIFEVTYGIVETT